MKHTSMLWHNADTSGGQGLVIAENGDNVAVSYSMEDAPLIAAAPRLLKALRDLYSVVVEREQDNHDLDMELNEAETAIAEAEELAEKNRD